MQKILLAILLIAAGAMMLSAQAGKSSSQPPLEIRLPAAPKITTMGGKPNILYELHLTNFGSRPLCLDKLEIKDAGSARIIAAFSAKELKARFYRPGAKSGEAEAVALDAGNAGVIYIEATDLTEKFPDALIHKISGSICGGDSADSFVIDSLQTRILREPSMSLGAPLKGGPWTAIFDPAWERGHRRVVYTIDGAARIPGRFAIDFMKLDQNGRFSSGNEDEIKNWYGYNAEVLAVADGIVSSVRNDFPESPTLKDHPQYPADQATGNYISIRIAENLYAFYEHLKPGSILVKPGQKVKKGTVIAKLGFTGQTTGPHLHFHLADADSPLGAEGLPFIFEKFTLLGTYSDFSLFGKSPWQISGAPSGRRIINEHPLSNSVITFN